MADTFTITELFEDEDSDVPVLRAAAEFLFDGYAEAYTDADGTEQTRPRVFAQQLVLPAGLSSAEVLDRLRSYAANYRAGLDASPTAAPAAAPPKGLKSLLGKSQEV